MQLLLRAYLMKATNTYVEPDISVICNPDKLDDKGCTGDRIGLLRLFPTSRRMDYYTKLFKYRTAGVREYWIIDAGKESDCEYMILSMVIWRSTHCRTSVKVGISRRLA